MTIEDLRLAIKMVNAAIVDMSKVVNGDMDDRLINAVLDELEDDFAPKVLKLLNAVVRESALERDTLTGVVYHPAGRDKVAHITVHQLREDPSAEAFRFDTGVGRDWQCEAQPSSVLQN